MIRSGLQCLGLMMRGGGGCLQGDDGGSRVSRGCVGDGFHYLVDWGELFKTVKCFGWAKVRMGLGNVLLDQTMVLGLLFG